MSDRYYGDADKWFEATYVSLNDDGERVERTQAVLSTDWTRAIAIATTCAEPGEDVDKVVCKGSYGDYMRQTGLSTDGLDISEIDG